MTSTQYGRSLDRVGLERQIGFGELKNKFLIFAEVTGSHEVKAVQADQERKTGLTSINGRLARRDLILSVKNELN